MATTETDEIRPDLAARLPNELVEEILSALVREFDHNPSYQWIQLRHLSRRQRHLIETHFQNFWLPTVSITLYLGRHHQIDYKFCSVERSDNSDYGEPPSCLAVFRADQRTVFHEINTPNPFTPAALARLWREYLAEDKPDCGRTASIRFGEGVLNGGLSGGHIFNVAELHGLRFDASDGSEIRFSFRETITQVMRDEFWLRHITLDLISEHRHLSESDTDTETSDTSAASESNLDNLNDPKRSEAFLEKLVSIQNQRYVKLVQRRAEADGRRAEFCEGTHDDHGMYRPRYLVESDDESWPDDDGDDDDNTDYDPESDDDDPSSAASSDSDEEGHDGHANDRVVKPHSDGGHDDDDDDDDDDLDPSALRHNVQGGFYENEQTWGRKGGVCCHSYHADGRCCCERNRAAFCMARFPPDLFQLRRLEAESMVPYLPIAQSVVQRVSRGPPAAAVPCLLEELKEIYRLYGYEADLNITLIDSWTWEDQHPLVNGDSAAEILMRVRESNRRNGQWVRVVEWPQWDEFRVNN